MSAAAKWLLLIALCSHCAADDSIERRGCHIVRRLLVRCESELRRVGGVLSGLLHSHSCDDGQAVLSDACEAFGTQSLFGRV